jgi:DeoR/GlpR family transcriptional regulator of sugar metabolism
MNEILEYLKKNGEKLDAEIAEANKLSLSTTRQYLAELAAKGKVMTYRSTRFVEGQKIEGIRCRLTGFNPHATPSQKQKAAKAN